MRAFDANKLFSNIASTTAAFNIATGGHCMFSVVATFGGGSVTLQVLGPDASTWLNASSPITVNQTVLVDIPAGTYRIAVATATGVYAELRRVPGE